MKACASCSGGVMFIPETVERKTNKQKSVSYKDIACTSDEKPSLRKRILGALVKKSKAVQAA